MTTEDLVEIKPYYPHKGDSPWMFPPLVKAVLDLNGWTIHARGILRGGNAVEFFCDVWMREKIEESPRDARVFNGRWSTAKEEAIRKVVAWVEAGCPKGDEA